MIDDEFAFISELVRDCVQGLTVLLVVGPPKSEAQIPNVLDGHVERRRGPVKIRGRNQPFERVDVVLEPGPTLRIEARIRMDLFLVLLESHPLSHWEKYP